MSYSFDYNLGKLPREFFREVAKIVSKREIHRKLGSTSRTLVKKFKVDNVLGIQIEDAISVVEDLIEVNLNSAIKADEFKTKKEKVLLLPHCCRKYMDSRCKAKFNKEVSSYICTHCSSDCLANKAAKLGKDRGYKVFILPGGSCIRKILEKTECEAIFAVACPEEVSMCVELVESKGKICIGIPLTKNGCSKTKFSLKDMKETLV
ncbi:MAG: DUF116 domain-containing protein [Candidatus Aenigmarchaeota archaeon]|nr:DUF116 domain-containing protein [Candidatus Aenigmarchaeota archaeon]